MRWVLRDVEIEQLARGELVIEPVHGPMLQVGQRIVLRRARQFVPGNRRLLLPRLALVRGICDGRPSIQSPRPTVWPP